MNKKDVKTRMNIHATFENMVQSSFFLVLGERTFVNNFRDKGDCYQQILMARALKKPVILMEDRQLQPLERIEMHSFLEGMEIIGTVSFDSKTMDDKVLYEMREILERWKKTRSIQNS